MRKISIILSLIALTVSSYGQPTNPENLVRSDEAIHKIVYGDLNNDGIEDCVIITKQTRKEGFVKDERSELEIDRNRRGISIAFKEREYYNLFVAISDCFSSDAEDGGVYFAPELSVEIKKGNLIIHYNHGRYGWWQYIFRYRNNNFELIGYDDENMVLWRMERSKSINFLTKKKKTRINTNLNAENESEYVIEETWQCIKLEKTINLIDIKDFDEFNINDCYSEIECK